MSLAAQFRALIDRRAALAAELSGIDAELTEARGLLVEMFSGASAVVTEDEPPLRAHDVAADSTCERCGKRFARKLGQSGRFCSRECWAVPPDRRRVIILERLAIAPTGASDLAKLSEMGGISAISVQNDLQKLRREGLVRSSEEGWRLTSAQPQPVQRIAPHRVDDEEFETVWAPGKDAPSLTGDRPSKPAGYGR